jgi:multidrug efflux pump
MLGVTFFGLLLTPVFYVLIRRYIERKTARQAARAHSLKVIEPEAH